MIRDAGRRQRVLAEYQATRRLPTIVAAVLDDGQIAWRGHAGAAVADDAQFRIGSITKTVTAVLVLQAVAEGLISLDEPIGRVVPETGYRDATVRALLAHTAGLQAEPAGDWWERSAGRAAAELLAGDDGRGAVAAPGAEWHYSNLGFALLGQAVSRVRGREWWELARDRVLGPLGLEQTTYLPRAPAATGLSVHHLRGTLVEEPSYDTGAMAPAGQLWSTLDDLAAFARFLRDGDERVLPQEQLLGLREIQPPATDYGLGLQLASVAGRRLIGHHGSMPGFKATLQIDPETGVGLVALTNATTGFAGQELAERLLGDHEPVTLPPWRPTTAVPDWAAELLGWWFWGNSAFEVRWENDALEWRELALGVLAARFVSDQGRIVGRLGYSSGETLEVRRDASGGVVGMACCTFVYTRTPYAEAPRY